MKRREFIGLVSGAAAALLRAAQAQGNLRRVAIILAATTENDPEYERRLSSLREGLRALGWIDGQNLKLSVQRTSPGAADIRKGVAELIAGDPEVIVSGGGTTTPHVQQAINSVPVVFASATDPVGSGLVESLSHPGGNITGFMQFDYSLSAKWLELLKQVSPATVRVWVIRDAATATDIGQFASSTQWRARSVSTLSPLARAMPVRSRTGWQNLRGFQMPASSQPLERP
jgi:putative ABC transport system substrate-binding protein